MKLFFLLFALSLNYSVFAQKPGAIIDVKHYTFSIDVNDENNTIICEASIEYEGLKNAETVSFDLASPDPKGKGMKVTAVTLNGKAAAFRHDQNRLDITAKVSPLMKSTIVVKYSGEPSDGLIISKTKYGRRSFFADNWPDRARNWIVCVDDPADKAGVDFLIKAPLHYQVVANGLLVEETEIANGKRFTHWRETIDLPTKVMTLGIADFAVEHIDSTGNVRLSSWVYPEDREKGFYDFRIAKEIIPFFEKYVAPFPYRKLANVQSKTIFGGLENAGAIFYSENLVTGTRRGEPTIAHEIAHQWFGDMATETDYSHIWLSEGFATFLTMFYMENKYGIDSVRTLLKKDREQIIAFAAEKPVPVVDSAVKSLMDHLNVNSYQKGGWILRMLRFQLGEETFWKGIQLYYKTYGGKNARTEDLQKCLETVSGKDLNQFFYQWFFVPGQPDLKLRWKYDKSKKMVQIIINQLQEPLFIFPISVFIGGKETVVAVKNKETVIEIPSSSAPVSVEFDKEVKLLFKSS
ncbi:MAG: M1 family aminopeptidase [Flavitalea sp.]